MRSSIFKCWKCRYNQCVGDFCIHLNDHKIPKDCKDFKETQGNNPIENNMLITGTLD